MRLLFISSTTGGGSGRSQRELASRLVDFGHEVRFLVDDKSPRRLSRRAYEVLSDLAVHARSVPGVKWIQRLERVPGSHPTTETRDGLSYSITPVPENALEQLLDSFRPDVVVANSFSRLGWRKTRATCLRRGVATVLYAREVTTLEHLTFGDGQPNALVANAESLAAAFRARGVECSFVPSVIETGVTKVESTREVALMINPIPSKGGDVVLAIAQRLPNIQFVLQESWPLDDDQLLELTTRASQLGNVSLRRVRPPGPGLYGDARVVLVPYRMDSRPRVIPEAQANGIPVIVAKVPALVEAIGAGGLSAEMDDLAAWCDALECCWGDGEHYERLSQFALEHSRRPEIDPVEVARSFEQIAIELVAQ